MKPRSKTSLLAIGVAFFCGALVVVELFHLHPQINIGNFHAYWTGFRDMRFESGTGTVSLTGGRQEIQKDYHIGPMMVFIIHES
jgi:hypothetical protein